MAEKTVLSMGSFDEKGNVMNITVEGSSDMPFWKHDLKIEAAMALLDTIDLKDFAEHDMYEKYFKYVHQLKELVEALEKG